MAFDTLSTAQNLVLTTHYQGSAGTVSPTNPFDYYRFHLQGRSSLRVILTELSGNANLEIVQDRDRNGTIESLEILHRSANSGVVVDRLTPILDAGTYFIRVSATTETANYGLRVSEFNDIKPDLIWRNVQTGENAVWNMNWNSSGVMLQAKAWLPFLDPSWQIAGSGDFNTDGQADLVLRNAQTGQNALWYMNGTTRLGSEWLPGLFDRNWQIVGVNDFNSDTRPDLVWRNFQTGENAVWYMNGVVKQSSDWLPFVDLSWEIAETGDLNQDRKPDLILRNAQTGQNAAWLMNGAVKQSGGWLPSLADRNWQIVGINDFNNDTFMDLLWRNPQTGQNAVWYLNATLEKISSEWLPGLFDRNWQIAGTSRRVNEPPLIETTHDLSGNHPDSAGFFIGVLNGTGVFRDRVNAIDTQDIYEFTLEDMSDITVSLTGLSASVTVQIQNEQRGVIQTASGSGLSNRTASLRLNPGKYRIRIFEPTGDTAYNLEVTGTVRPVYRYDFRYLYNGRDTTGDSYTGYVFAPLGTYTVNQFFDANPASNETGSNGLYFISRSQKLGTLSDLGKVFVDAYSDADSSRMMFVPRNFAWGIASGTNYLGSEADTIALGERLDSFGWDQTEADIQLLSSIRVTNSLRQGLPTEITWSDTLNENVRIDLLKGGVFHSTIAASTESDGSFSWTPTTALAIASDYQIQITSVLDWRISTTSQLFSVTSPGTVRVTNPNGGNVLRPNSSYTLTWTDDFGENVRIELLKGGVFHSTIAASTESDGNHTWTLPANLSNGSDYQIRIASTLNTLVSDLSDSFFSIQLDLKRYWFTYNYNPGNSLLGDSYIGSVIAADGMYLVNSTFDPAIRTTEAGLNGSYFISRVEDYDDRLTNEMGRVFVQEYIDRDNGAERRFTPRLHRQGQAAGLGYLGSELDFIDDVQSEDARFGQDQFEADPALVTLSNLAFSRREGDTGTVRFRLAVAPTSNVTVTFTNGSFLTIDADNTINNGTQNSITFTPTNWNVDRTIWFIAEQDGTTSDRTFGNTISYTLSGGLTGSGVYNLGTVTNTYAPDTSRFNIDLDFRNDYLGFWTPARRAIAQRAANDWAARIMSELASIAFSNQSVSMYNPNFLNLRESFFFTSNRVIDDLVVFVGAYNANDGAGGWGGVRLGGQTVADPIPRAGMFTFNSFFSDRYNDSSLYSLVSHEIGHVLGLLRQTPIGVSLTDTATATFRGENARRANGGSYVRLQAADGPNPVTGMLDYSHPANSVRSIMSYGWTYNLSAPTEIDYAMLADLGYRISGINAGSLPIAIDHSVSSYAPDTLIDSVFACGCAKHLAAAAGFNTIGSAKLTDILDISETV